jgi:aryl-alcohol dehydrogenase-like predicted oxidoreductase
MLLDGLFPPRSGACDAVKRVVISGTDLSVSRLALGLGSLHHVPTSSRRQALLSVAFDLGFTHFDSSPYYGFGLAEAELGRFLRKTRTEVTVASKVGLYPPGGRQSHSFLVYGRKALGKLMPSLSRVVESWSLAEAERSLEATLRALGRDYVDLLLLHEPPAERLDPDRFYEWFEKLREKGKIRWWGLAGPIGCFAAWLSHPVARVIQVPDRDVPSLARMGRQAQFTYGALSDRPRNQPAREALAGALVRNAAGSVIVSSRRAAHLRELAEWAERNDCVRGPRVAICE